jgi:hypothetical protein
LLAVLVNRLPLAASKSPAAVDLLPPPTATAQSANHTNGTATATGTG